MELAQEMIEIQVSREAQMANENNRTITGFKTFDGSGIVATFNGRVLGQVQAITYEASHPPSESETVEREFYIGHSYEGSMTVENAEVNQDLLRELMYQELISYSIESPPEPNRAERRKKEKQKRAEASDNQYRKELKNMLGGRKRWS